MYTFQDLKTYLIEQRKLPEMLLKNGLILRMACNISAALQHMHEHGFVHTYVCFVSLISTLFYYFYACIFPLSFLIPALFPSFLLFLNLENKNINFQFSKCRKLLFLKCNNISYLIKSSQPGYL